MEQSLKEELVHWTELLQSRCFALNTALIKANNLDKQAELAEWNSFSCPARAVRLSLLPRTGTVSNDNEALAFTYHIHGGGITIQTGDGEKINFQYFPQPESGPKPILGLWAMQQFISSINPHSLLSDSHVLASVLEELFQAGLLVRIHEQYLEFYLK